MAAFLRVPPQSNVFGNPIPATSAASAPLLQPEGYTDENGWTWPGTEWKQVSPESEGFSAERLDALRSFLKTHQTDGMMVISRGARCIRVRRREARQQGGLSPQKHSQSSVCGRDSEGREVRSEQDRGPARTLIQ
jgi:hypothetical protein